MNGKSDKFSFQLKIVYLLLQFLFFFLILQWEECVHNLSNFVQWKKHCTTRSESRCHVQLLMDYTVHGILPARILEWVAYAFSRGSSQGSNPDLLHFGQILYQMSHQGKPRNTGMGSLSLLQWIFLTQESNPGLLHCRQILCQLSY